jgi:ATP-dependent RNA helicase DDX5/DBP2
VPTHPVPPPSPPPQVQKFGRSSGVQNTCVYGGAPKGPQLRDINNGVHCVIATPGRLNDFIESRMINLRQVGGPWN